MHATTDSSRKALRSRLFRLMRRSSFEFVADLRHQEMALVFVEREVRLVLAVGVFPPQAPVARERVDERAVHAVILVLAHHAEERVDAVVLALEIGDAGRSGP